MFQLTLLLLCCTCFGYSKKLDDIDHTIGRRALQRSHEKSQGVKWMEAFFGKKLNYDQAPSLINLINTVAIRYLAGCTTVVLYDRIVETSDLLLLEQLFKTYPIPYMHGQINTRYSVNTKVMLNSFENKCVTYILFLADVMRCKEVIGEQNENKVVVIARSSQWRVYEFLESDIAQSFVNLLVVAQSEKIVATGAEIPYILYTHKMYIDGLGSSAPQVLTSWIKGKLTRPEVPLFPPKIKEGFSGHRFIISVAHQPPFVIKRGQDENDEIRWDGVEVRLIKLLAEIYNFTTDLREAKEIDVLGPGDAVAKEVQNRKANLGMAGLYITSERIGKLDIAQAHSQDCASFISLTSTALPRYRAIMGPFHWSVWLALSIIYLFAIFPLTFSDRHSLKYLLESPEEVENMFWYVFGTFTNCFSFTGNKSWTTSDKLATRLLIGFYWVFTIIITACYTGSIIAFVTLPTYPATIDTAKQLVAGRFQIGTLDKGGWQYWFENSSDPITKKLMKDVELLPTIESGLRNTTKAFFWSYAFLGSRAQLDYIVRTNFTTKNKRSLLHISSECFVPYGVSITFTLNSVYKAILNQGLLHAMESGFVIKFAKDIEWDMMRSATGKLLQANSGGSMRMLSADDRALTLDDTQGMFLLLATGFVLGGASLLSEWFGGCFNLCKKVRRRSLTDSISSNPRSYDNPTPRQKLDSIAYNYNSKFRLDSITDEEKGKNNDENNETTLSQNTDAAPTNENETINDYSEISNEINKIFNFNELFGNATTSEDKPKKKEQ